MPFVTSQISIPAVTSASIAGSAMACATMHLIAAMCMRRVGAAHTRESSNASAMPATTVTDSERVVKVSLFVHAMQLYRSTRCLSGVCDNVVSFFYIINMFK